MASLTAYAVEHSPELHSREFEIDAAEARVRQARFNRQPSLGFESGYDWNRYPQRLTPARANGEGGTFDEDLWRAELVLKVPLDTSRRLLQELSAAGWRREAATAQARRVRQELVFSLSAGFFRLLGQEKLIEALEFSRQTMQEHLERIRLFVEEKKAAPVELLRFEVRVAEIERQLVKERNEREIQRQTLASRCGWQAGSGFPRLSGDLSLPAADAPSVASEATEIENGLVQALAQRPDYQALTSYLKAQESTIQAARAAQRPTVSLQGTLGRR